MNNPTRIRPRTFDVVVNAVMVSGIAFVCGLVIVVQGALATVT